MFSLPQERSVRMALVIALFVVALGFFFFEGYRAVLGRFEDDIVSSQAAQITAHPEVKQVVDGQSVTPDVAAAKAWERIKFFHVYGYLMVLSTLGFVLLIANVSILAARVKAILLWLSLVAMFFYNVGWGLAGWLVPFMGAKPAK